MQIDENSGQGGVKTVTIPGVAASTAGPDQACRSCQILHLSGTGTFMNITGDASAVTWPLSSTIPTVVPIQNLNKLNFFGTAADKVIILWRD